MAFEDSLNLLPPEAAHGSLLNLRHLSRHTPRNRLKRLHIITRRSGPAELQTQKPLEIGTMISITDAHGLPFYTVLGFLCTLYQSLELSTAANPAKWPTQAILLGRPVSLDHAHVRLRAPEIQNSHFWRLVLPPAAPEGLVFSYHPAWNALVQVEVGLSALPHQTAVSVIFELCPLGTLLGSPELPSVAAEPLIDPFYSIAAIAAFLDWPAALPAFPVPPVLLLPAEVVQAAFALDQAFRPRLHAAAGGKQAVPARAAAQAP
jgi:hypothetical protein